jgi:hypothetical protein
MDLFPFVKKIVRYLRRKALPLFLYEQEINAGALVADHDDHGLKDVLGVFELRSDDIAARGDNQFAVPTDNITLFYFPAAAALRHLNIAGC